MKVGAFLFSDKTQFVVWAPLRQQCQLRLHGKILQDIPMQRDASGYWQAELLRMPPGQQYSYVLDKIMERPDPASFAQPEGVHRSSAIVDHDAFHWHDLKWKCTSLSDWVIYEMHVGAFTQGGTFASALRKLDRLAKLGITTIELMPIAQFPGKRNWGYDGVYPYAVQHSYGGAQGLKTFVNACHQRGLAVILDVVYNHLGPEGNYLRDYGPYFTNRYQTPWGDAINYDGAWSPGVRNYFIQNALYWFQYFHVDALRIDAVHAIYDFSATHFLKELSDVVKRWASRAQRSCYLIAESDLNDPKLLRTPAQGGFGLNAQWSDDFHHALHTLVTGERQSYYMDFGQLQHFSKAFCQSFTYDGCYSAFRLREHGASATDLPPKHFIVSAQNHDQIGNRPLGERLTRLTNAPELKLAAASVLLSPYIPLIFMGEEYGETHPFLYFIDHGDPRLIAAVQRGRKREFSEFFKHGEPPDPAAQTTFQKSILSWKLTGKTQTDLYQCYRSLIKLRHFLSRHAGLVQRRPKTLDWGNDTIAVFHIKRQRGAVIVVFHFGTRPVSLRWGATGVWQKLWDSRKPGKTITLKKMEVIQRNSNLTVFPKTAMAFWRGF